MHIVFLKSYYNILIKSVVTSFSEEKVTYRIKRKDKYFAGFGFIVIVFYGLYFLNIFEWIYQYTDIPLYYENYYYLYNKYILYENFIKKVFYTVVIFTLFEGFFLKNYFQELDLKNTG